MGTATYAIAENRSVPSYRRFLKNPTNKAALTEFLSTYLTENLPQALFDDQVVIIAGGFSDGKKAVRITKDGSNEVAELNCSHEEADTRMLFHAIEMSSRHQKIIINADDADTSVARGGGGAVRPERHF